MITKRVIACLDVKEGKVVKGLQFRNHKVLGDIEELALKYCEQGADELVFYDISASAEGRVVGRDWISKVAKLIDIPFCVAGGIRSVSDAKKVLESGADKISINSPAIDRPGLVTELAEEFGKQCVVVGIDSKREGVDYFVYQYTGKEETSRKSPLRTLEWINRVQVLGAGEVVLNCMNQDGVGRGFDCEQLALARNICKIPLIASGGAGSAQHFIDVFARSGVDGALAAGIFHRNDLDIRDLKAQMKQNCLEVRPV